MKRNHTNKKHRTKKNKKRNITIKKKRGGGEFDETIKSQMRTMKGCFPEFYEPTEDKTVEIKKSLASLGIDLEKQNIKEKPELVKYYESILTEYIEDKREIFFDIIPKLLLDKKIPDSKYPKQNIVPTLCCMSLIEKMKAISRIAKHKAIGTLFTRNINDLFNPNHIDKYFLEKVENEKNKQEILKLEIFLKNNGIARPIVSDTGKKNAALKDALTLYIRDLIQIYNSPGTHAAVDDMLIGVFNTKIKEIIEEKEKQENMKKEQEKHTQDQKKILYSIINNLKGTGGLFGEARNTLPYFSNREKINIIQKLSPGIAKILQSELETELDKTGSNKEIDDTLIDILHQKYDDVLKNKNA
jgi:hypothetical protein